MLTDHENLRIIAAIVAAGVAAGVVRGMIQGVRAWRGGWRPSRTTRIFVSAALFWWFSLFVTIKAGLLYIGKDDELIAFVAGPPALLLTAFLLQKWVSRAPK